MVWLLEYVNLVWFQRIENAYHIRICLLGVDAWSRHGETAAGWYRVNDNGNRVMPMMLFWWISLFLVLDLFHSLSSNVSTVYFERLIIDSLDSLDIPFLPFLLLIFLLLIYIYIYIKLYIICNLLVNENTHFCFMILLWVSFLSTMFICLFLNFLENETQHF